MNRQARPGAHATAEAVRMRLREQADPARAAILRRFFKTGPGEYGEGDDFLGLGMPAVRSAVREFRGLHLPEALSLLRSGYHEERMSALLLLCDLYAREDERTRQSIYEAYLDHADFIDNWDLVDLSAEHVLGAHLLDRDRSPLRDLAASQDLWRRRIAVMATFHFIRRGDFAETLALASILIGDRHDLIHKAVGWMLREIGKRDQAVEESFLRVHCRTMPRTMLRYAIEKFPAPLRLSYLAGPPPAA